MTIQKNEKKEIKQSNEPLIFTKEERAFIKQSIRITREGFKEELSSDNEKDIREAIRLYHNRYNMPGGKPHTLMRSIFRKMGYWDDGRTTLEQRERNLIEKKMANERRLADMNLKRTKALDEQLVAIKLEQEKLAKDPILHKNNLATEYKRIEEEFKKKLELEKQEQTLKLQKFLQEQQEAYEKTVKTVFQNAEKEKERLQQLAMRDAITQTQNKLVDVNLELEKVTPPISTVESELKKQIEVIDLELQDVEGKTVAQLRDICKEKGIKWTYNHRKADLIELIQNTIEG